MNLGRTLVLCVALALTFSLVSAGGVAAQDAATLHRTHNLLGESIGAAGFDPVSYFPEGGGIPEKGLIKFAFQHEGVTYRFVSQDHVDRFKADPERYEPRFGGWCAWAVGQLGKRVDVDPESYLIRDGHLYLFYRDKELDTRSLWLKNETELRQKAETNWPGLAK